MPRTTSSRRRPGVTPAAGLLPFLAIALVLPLLAVGQPARAQDPADEPPADAAPAPDAGAGAAGEEPLDPNPFRFAKDPRRLDRWTSAELWDAVDYLTRIGQTPAAVPFLDAFLARKADDATLLAIRDQYGLESILRLQDDPATAARALPLLNLVSAATRRETTNPAQLDRSARALGASPAEQAFALARLREGGADAVPAVLRALRDPGLTPEARALIAANLGGLESPAVPPLLAALEAPDPALVADVARALGRIGDPRAVPFLVGPAARADSPAAVRAAAAEALTRLRRPLATIAPSPARYLAAEARRYFEHQVPFPDGPFLAWLWQEDGPIAVRTDRGRSERYFADRLARQALALEPANLQARAVAAALALSAPGAEPEAGAARLEADPAVLAEVLRAAVARNDGVVGAAAAQALGRVTNAADLVIQGESHPLVQALVAPSRRTRLAAARAIVALDPQRPFAGSGRVVRALVPFLTGGRDAPRAVVVDPDAMRGNAVGMVLRSLGFDTTTAPDGPAGFRQAAESADVEAVLIEPSQLHEPWTARDLLTNLRADARTAAVPVYLLKPLDVTRAYRRLEQLARPTREQEPNDTQPLANGLSFSDRPREARVEGVLPAFDGLGDVYALGRLAAGDTIVAAVVIPPSSPLRVRDVVLTVERGDGARLATAPGQLSFAAPTAGLYYVRVQSQGPERTRTSRAQYVLDVRLAEVNPGPLGTELEQSLADLAARFPRVAVLTQPQDPGVLRQQFARAQAAMGGRPLTDAERDEYAREAAVLLARIAARPQGPLATDLVPAEPGLALALNFPGTAEAAAAALALVPSANAQRSLAAAALDGAAPPPTRVAAARALAASLARFGRLITGEQELALNSAVASEPDPAVRAALDAAYRAVLPTPVLNAPRPAAPGGR